MYFLPPACIITCTTTLFQRVFYKRKNMKHYKVLCHIRVLTFIRYQIMYRSSSVIYHAFINSSEIIDYLEHFLLSLSYDTPTILLKESFSYFHYFKSN